MSLVEIMPAKGQSLGAHLTQGTLLGVVLTAASYLVGLHFGWITGLDWLEVFAVFTSYLCTFLCVVERRINYPIGAASTAAYCVLFLKAGLLASMAINGFLAVYLVYGWIRWRTDSNARPVTRMTFAQWVIYAIVAAVGYAIVLMLATMLGGHLAWTDSFIMAGTILAQFMLDNKKLENWGIWALVNVFAIYTYFTAGLALAGFQYIFFLANTVYGFYMWKVSKDTQMKQAEYVKNADLPEAVIVNG